jgi:hypothetical protein
VHNGGSVSIGSTLTPATGCKLQMVSNAVFTQNAGTIQSAAFLKGMNSYSSASIPDYTWYNNTNTGIFHPDSNVIGFSVKGKESCRLAPSGNVLIGTATEWSEKLSVSAGDQPAIVSYVNHSIDYKYAQVSYVNRHNSKAISARYNLNDKFIVYGNGDVWAYGHYTGSDSLLKENILPISDPLKKLMELNGVTFNYKPEELKDPDDTITVISTELPKTIMGLIAEDVELVVPEVVNTFDEGRKGILYGNLVALLIEAIKEQQLQIEELQAAIASYSSQQSTNPPGLNRTDLKEVEKKEEVENSDRPVLFQNIPNPFTEQTQIRYYLPDHSRLAFILIFDMQGTLLETYSLADKGYSSLILSGGSFRPGMYMYALISDGKEIDTKKMILTK